METTNTVSVGMGVVGSSVMNCRICVDRSGRDLEASDVDANTGWGDAARAPVCACCGNEVDGCVLAKL